MTIKTKLYFTKVALQRELYLPLSSIVLAQDHRTLHSKHHKSVLIFIGWLKQHKIKATAIERRRKRN